jgi:hypothetical protein
MHVRIDVNYKVIAARMACLAQVNAQNGSCTYTMPHTTTETRFKSHAMRHSEDETVL